MPCAPWQPAQPAARALPRSALPEAAARSVSLFQTTVVGTAAAAFAIGADPAGRVMPAARQIASHQLRPSAFACNAGNHTKPITIETTATAKVTSQPVKPSRSLFI